MSCFTETRVLATSAPDPTKHVNFVRGMVLGEDEFKQEFAWLSGRDQWLARDLIGYGTVRGLKVQVEQEGTKGPRIYVHPGVALTPVGQLVCVPSPQCANLNDWLKKNAAEVQPAVASPPQNPLPLYVVLCYRECPTDKVPIPGEPCRSEDQLVQPSRLRDDFVLEISLKRPAHREEEALIKFCKRLRDINMTDETATSPSLEDFLNWLRGVDGPESPPASPPTSPPGGLRVHPNDAAAYLRAAFHLWTTELRPKWFARWYGCAPDKDEPVPLEDCVLLAEVQVPLIFNAGEGAYQVSDTQFPTVIDGERPYVLHLRMLQEWLIGGTSALPTGNPTLPAVPNPATMVVAETTFGLAPASGNSTNYAREDHTHGTPPLSALPSLGGDASGPIPNATVNRIRGVDVFTGGATIGDVLTFVSDVGGTGWQPRPLPAASTQFVSRATPQPYTIVAAGQVQFPLAPGGVPPGAPATVMASYNGLVAVTPYNAASGGFRFTFTLFAPGAIYIVKLTPWVPQPLPTGAPSPFFAHLFDFVPAIPGAPAGFVVTIAPNPGAPMVPIGRLMIEVSQIG